MLRASGTCTLRKIRVARPSEVETTITGPVFRHLRIHAHVSMTGRQRNRKEMDRDVQEKGIGVVGSDLFCTLERKGLCVTSQRFPCC